MRVGDDVSLVPGAGETALDAGTRALLPCDAPPAPWRCRADALLWFARPSGRARQALEPAVARHGAPIAVIGGFVRYTDTPVGRYDEVLAAVVLMTRRGPRGSVPFMAVDSPASLLGGRANWSLPKTLVRFSGAPAPATPVSAATPAWAVRARARALPRGVPVGAAGRLLQQWPDGLVRSSRLRSTGAATPAVVRVDVRSTGSLPDWLRPGRHPGVLLDDVDFTLEPAGEATAGRPSR